MYLDVMDFEWQMKLTRLLNMIGLSYSGWSSTIDNLLGSKFVGYTANFSENTVMIIEGAEIFSPFDAVTTTSSSNASDGNYVCIG